MALVHLYLPGQDHGVVMPRSEISDRWKVLDSYAEAGGEFSRFTRPYTEYNVTPEYWKEGEDATYRLTIAETPDAAVMWAQPPRNAKGMVLDGLAKLYAGTENHTVAVMIPSQSRIFTIPRPYRLLMRARHDVLEVGGCILSVAERELKAIQYKLSEGQRYG